MSLNDGRDGFQTESDALIHLSKYTIGCGTPISIIYVHMVKKFILVALNDRCAF